MTKNRLYLHYLSLAGVIAIGAILRFCNLDFKPLWMDEVITAIFSLGKKYNDLPLDVVFSLERVQEIFTYQPGTSCTQIAQTLATQSTHPPLFFCWMYSWLGWISPLGENWVTKLRSLPVLFGVGAIAAIYCVNRLAFSRTVGLMAAMVMAVSPFAVYLSQEARHYTLPMLLITLSLLGLVQIQKDIFQRQKFRFWVWLVWTIINIIGLYIHYFFLLALIAELGTLLILVYWYRANITNKKHIWLALILSMSAVAISFLPWLPVLMNDYNRPETDWIDPPSHIAPLYQTLIGWVVMVIVLPVENQPLPIVVISAFLMLFFGVWLGWQVCKGLKKLWFQPKTHLATLTLLSFSIWVLLEFFAIAYFLKKDITAVPRYNFVSYPSFCALISASLNERQKSIVSRHKTASKEGLSQAFRSEHQQKIQNRNINNKSLISSSFTLPSGKPPSGRLHPSPFILHPTLREAALRASTSFILFIVGLLSCVFVISNLAFVKPFVPEQVAQTINQDPSIPLMIVVGYRNYQDVALGLSFGLALDQIRSRTKPPASADFAFFKQSPDFQSVWQKLSQLPPLTTSKLNLWVIAPGIKRRDYPQQVALSQATTCTINIKQHYRVGVPYQLYQCNDQLFK